MSVRHKSEKGICMVTGSYYPEISGGALQSYHLVESLAENFDFFVISSVKVTSQMRRQRNIFNEERVGNAMVFRFNIQPQDIVSEIFSFWGLLKVFFKIRNKVYLIHLYGVTRKGLLVVLLAKLCRKKVVIETTSVGIDDPRSIMKQSLVSWKLYSLADAYIVTAPAQESSYRNTGLPTDRLFMIGEGVDLERFSIPSAQEKLKLRSALGIPPDKEVILSVAFFSRDKALDIFADSLLLLPKERRESIFLIFVGSRDYKENEVDKAVVDKVNEIIDHLDLRRQTLFVDSTLSIEKYFKAADIFVFPSKREGLPNALLEAMGCGLCCISNTLPGITDYLITHEESGLLLDALTPQEIAKALKEVVGNKKLQQSLGAKARQRVEKDFAMNIIRDQHIKLYATLMGNRLCAE